MTWLVALKLLLQLVALVARRAERSHIERMALNELENLHRSRVDGAADARDDVLSGRVQPDDNDPHRRD